MNITLQLLGTDVDDRRCGSVRSFRIDDLRSTGVLRERRRRHRLQRKLRRWNFSSAAVCNLEAPARACGTQLRLTGHTFV